LLPGLLYYLAGWIPAERRALAYSALMSTAALSSFLGGPIATALMSLDGLGGFAGWQIMFMVESVATILIGIAVLRYLPESPRQARWLDAAEQHYLIAAESAEHARKQTTGVVSLRACFSDRRVVLATLLNFFLICCNFGTVYWLPQMLKSLGGLTDIQVGLLASVPYGIGGLAMLAWGRSSDRHGDRKWHLAAGSVIAVVGYVWAGLAASPVSVFVGVCLATAGIWSTFGVFWAYAGDLLGGRAAAGGLALVNSVSTLGGLIGPAAIGLIRERSASFGSSLLGLAALAAMAVILASLLEPRAATAQTESA
jgi:MFS family permease